MTQAGFSTKGKGRGFGLSILSDLINASPNISLSTRMENELFTQTLIIGGERNV